jgi:hypothetical protein
LLFEICCFNFDIAFEKCFVSDQLRKHTYGSSTKSKERYRNIEPFLTPDLTRRHQKENSQSYRHDFGPFTEEPPRAKSVLSLNNFKKFKDATR